MGTSTPPCTGSAIVRGTNRVPVAMVVLGGKLGAAGGFMQTGGGSTAATGLASSLASVVAPLPCDASVSGASVSGASVVPGAGLPHAAVHAANNNSRDG